jgi:hypothetical protein
MARGDQGAVDGASMKSDTAGGVAGTYRAVASGGLLTSWRLQIGAWGLFALLQLVQLLLALRRESGPWVLSLYVAGFALGSVTAWLVWSSRTVVSPEDVRVKRGFRWRALAWEQIADVPETSRWSATKTITVTTVTGERVALDVPDALRDRFISCAAAHRQRDPGEHGPRTRDTPPQDVQ